MGRDSGAGPGGVCVGAGESRPAAHGMRLHAVELGGLGPSTGADGFGGCGVVAA